jgi:hypothetical protein
VVETLRAMVTAAKIGRMTLRMLAVPNYIEPVSPVIGSREGAAETTASGEVLFVFADGSGRNALNALIIARLG